MMCHDKNQDALRRINRDLFERREQDTPSEIAKLKIAVFFGVVAIIAALVLRWI
jgi:hypothetical protein